VHTVAIVQARTSSSRLPRKVLADIAGFPLIEHVLRRVGSARSIDDVVLATTTNDQDDPLIRIAERVGVRWFRGDEHDVLSRFVGAAHEAGADLVVRVTGDCPLIDPDVTDLVVRSLVDHESTVDYASNVVVRSFPRGLDVEAFFVDVLNRVDRFATTADEREHVTMAIYSSFANLFERFDVVAVDDDSDIRWTVDYPADLDVVRRCYESLGLVDNQLPYRDVVTWYRMHPEIGAANTDLETWSPPAR